MALAHRMILMAISDMSILSGTNCVLHIEPLRDEVVLIPIRSDLRGWFQTCSFKALSEELEPSNPNAVPKIVKVDEHSKDFLPPLVGLDDVEISKLYPPRDQRKIKEKNDDRYGESPISKLEADKIEVAFPKRDRKLSPVIAVRNYRELLIHSVLYHTNETKRSSDQLFEPGFIPEWIKQRLAEIGPSKRSYLYHCIRLYFVFGEDANALIGDYPECGAPGEVRKPKFPNTKLGRWNALYKSGTSTTKGFSLAGDDKEKERIEAFCVGKSPNDGPVLAWYDEYLAIFHHKSIQMIDGELVIELKPIEEMPTEDQFRDCIKKSGDVNAPWIQRLTAQEYEQNYLPQPGSATDGICKFGQLATLDLTSGDVYLRMRDDKLKAAGIASRIPTIDVLTGWTYGVHHFYGKHNEENALLAAYNAFTSKNWLGERLGLSFLNDESFPVFVPEAIFVDHDEFFTEGSKQKARHAGLNLIFPEANRGNKKPTIESDHRNNHADTGHRMSGTTKGRQRKKGEPNPEEEACWDIEGMMRADWRHRYMRNCVELVPHLVTEEMRADGVHRNPVRLNIIKWYIDNGYAKCSVADTAKLAIFCLPKIRARAKPDGIYLLRPDCGDANIFVKYLKYEIPTDCYRIWFGGPTKDGIDLVVGHHPYDLNAIHFAHPQMGVLRFAAKWVDPALQNISMPDLMKRQDETVLISQIRRPETLQARVNFTMLMKAEDASAKAEKKAEIEAQPVPPTKKSLRQGVRENQNAEQERLRKDFMPPGLKPEQEAQASTPLAHGEPPSEKINTNRGLARYPPKPLPNPMREKLKVILGGQSTEGSTS